MIEADNTKFALATQLFARLRRSTGRTIDVVWALKDAGYAREVLRVARAVPDSELAHLAERFEGLMFPAAATPADAAPPAPASAARAEAEISEHYIGHLR